MQKTTLVLCLILALALGATAAAASPRTGWGYCQYSCYNESTGEFQTFWPMGPMTQEDCCGGSGVVCPPGSYPVGVVAWAPAGGWLSICEGFSQPDPVEKAFTPALQAPAEEAAEPQAEPAPRPEAR